MTTRRANTLRICGGDMRESDEANNTCPNRAEHRYGPAGYVDWHEWAASMSRTHGQFQCPGCNRWLIYVPKTPHGPTYTEVGEPRG